MQAKLIWLNKSLSFEHDLKKKQKLTMQFISSLIPFSIVVSVKIYIWYKGPAFFFLLYLFQVSFAVKELFNDLNRDQLSKFDWANCH